MVHPAVVVGNGPAVRGELGSHGGCWKGVGGGIVCLAISSLSPSEGSGDLLPGRK